MTPGNPAREVIEAVARAIAHDEYPDRSWHGWSEITRERYGRMATAAIEAHTAALSAAGMVIVPREPTPEMIEAGKNGFDNIAEWGDYDDQIRQAYRAMIAALRDPTLPPAGE